MRTHITLFRLERPRNAYVSRNVGENKLASFVKGIQDRRDSQCWVNYGLYMTISALGSTRLAPLQTLIAWLYSGAIPFTPVVVVGVSIIAHFKGEVALLLSQI